MTTAAALAFGRLRGAARIRPRRVEATGESMPPVCFLVATSAHGVVMYERGRLIPVVPGNCYGMSRCGEWWYVFQRQGDFGRIVRFRLDGPRIRQLETVVSGLNYGVHQLDFVG